MAIQPAKPVRSSGAREPDAPDAAVDERPTQRFSSRQRFARLRWLMGWLVIPALIVASLFLAGMHVGARHPDMWLARLLVWLFG